MNNVDQGHQADVEDPQESATESFPTADHGTMLILGFVIAIFVREREQSRFKRSTKQAMESIDGAGGSRGRSKEAKVLYPATAGSH